MKKGLMALVIFFISISVNSAEWIKVVESQDGDVHYYDKLSLKIVKDEVFLLEMTDYIEPTPFGDLSSIHYNKINCSQKEITLLSQSYYSLPMGMGDKTSSSNITETSSIPEGTVLEATYDHFCNEQFLIRNK